MKQAIALAPNVAGPHYYLGLTLLNQKKLTEAETEFKVVLRLNPNDAQAQQALASLLKVK